MAGQLSRANPSHIIISGIFLDLSSIQSVDGLVVDDGGEIDVAALC